MSPSATTPGRPVLHDISLTREPARGGGAGGARPARARPRIIALTHRFYEVEQGQVLVGGHDVRDVTLDSLGKTIGMVLQEPFLFTGTIDGEHPLQHRARQRPRTWSRRPRR